MWNGAAVDVCKRAPSSYFPLNLLGSQNSGSCDKFCEDARITTGIAYPPTWINDLTARVIGERSSFFEKSGASEPLELARSQRAGREGGPVPLPLITSS